MSMITRPGSGPKPSPAIETKASGAAALTSGANAAGSTRQNVGPGEHCPVVLAVDVRQLLMAVDQDVQIGEWCETIAFAIHLIGVKW